MRQLIYNAIIINEGTRTHGYLEIDDSGRISAVCDGEPSESLINSYKDARRIDLQGRMLIPGVIDSHVHFREPGGEYKADIYSESRAAVAGGVTSYMEMPNTNPATTTVEHVELKAKIAKESSVANYSFYIGATASNIDELRAADYSLIPGVKLFMGSSTGNMMVDSPEALKQIFSLGVPVAVHCEDEATIQHNLSDVKNLYPSLTDITACWHPDIRSTLACYKSTSKALKLADEYGTRLHLMHVSTAQELALVQESKANVCAEACIAHLFYSDAQYPRLGNLIKCNPSIKSSMHRDAIRDALRTGIISVVSTDHAPHTLEEKQRPYIEAPSGIPMVQFSLPAMLHLASQGEWPIETVVEKMCHAQAREWGIVGRGFIRQGYAADLVCIDPEAETIINRDTILSKCKWSPLEGTKLRGAVIRTWVNGVEVYNINSGIKEVPGVSQRLEFIRP